MSTPYGPSYPAFQPNTEPAAPRVNFGWIGESFEYFKRAPFVWISLTFVYIGVTIGVSIALDLAFPGTPGAGNNSFNQNFQSGNSLGDALSNIVSLLIDIAFFSCAYHLAVLQVRGKSIGFGDTISGLKYFLPMLAFRFLLGVCILIGCFALCLGAFVAYGLLLPGFAMIADGAPISEAINRTFSIMKNDWLQAGLLAMSLVALTVLGFVACLLGEFVTIPMVCLVSALCYRDMIGLTDWSRPAYAPVGSPGVWRPPPADPSAPGQWPQAQPPTPGQWPPAQPPTQEQWPLAQPPGQLPSDPDESDGSQNP